MGPVWPRRSFVKWPSVVLAALNLTLALSFAGGGGDERVFKVLVAPGEGVQAGAFSRPSALTATLGEQPYKILSVERLHPGEGRTVVVLDFGATSYGNDACLLAEALTALGRIHESPPPVLIAGGNSRFKSSVNIGPGRDLVLYVGGDLLALTSECQAGHNPSSFKAFLQEEESRSFPSVAVFRSLRRSFASHDAPVRVFWLAEDFDLFVDWKSPRCWEDPLMRDVCGKVSAPPFQDIERVAEADLTFFPIVFGDRHTGRLRSPSRLHVQEAEMLAQATGGFVSTVSGGIGDTLARAIEKSREGVVFSLEGPVTIDGQSPTKAQTLTIQATSGDHPARWQRRFIVNREGSVKPAEYDLVPMIVPSIHLGLRYGCQTPDSSAGERTLELTVPPEVLNLSPGVMDVYLDYPSESGFRGQRTTLGKTPGGSGSFCLPLIHAHDGMKFRVVVVDRATGWVGAAAGVLGATNRGR
ncbi:MAG: hypothetical protein ABSC08_13555 [Bryobacteraceae bacterium]